MKKLVCTCHRVLFEIPTSEQEYYDDHLHAQILSCEKHLNEFSDCVLVEE